MKSETGESWASINRRRDDEVWPRVEMYLRAGATLLKMSHGINRYAIQEGNEPLHGPSISATRVRALEKEGVLCISLGARGGD